MTLTKKHSNTTSSTVSVYALLPSILSEQCATCFHIAQPAVTPLIAYFPPLEKQEKQPPNAETATDFHYTSFSNDMKNNVQITFSILHL